MAPNGLRMRIIVIGAGAVGGYYGARLAAAGHQVTFLARGTRLAALQAGGLALRSPLGDVTLPQVDARASWPDDQPADLALVAVKSYDTEAALRLLPPACDALTLQNGVENADLLLANRQPEQAVGGACRLEVDAPAPGQIVHLSPFALVMLGPLHPDAAPAAARAAEALRGAGVETRLLPDGRTAMWRKALLLTPFSGLTALLQRPWGDIRAQPEALAAADAMAAEIAAVGTALGVPDLGAEAIGEARAMFRAVPATMVSSLYRDRQRGRRLEVDGLQGAIVRAAERAGVAAPVTRALCGYLQVAAG